MDTSSKNESELYEVLQPSRNQKKFLKLSGRYQHWKSKPDDVYCSLLKVVGTKEQILNWTKSSEKYNFLTEEQIFDKSYFNDFSYNDATISKEEKKINKLAKVLLFNEMFESSSSKTSVSLLNSKLEPKTTPSLKYLEKKTSLLDLCKSCPPGHLIDVSMWPDTVVVPSENLNSELIGIPELPLVSKTEEAFEKAIKSVRTYKIYSGKWKEQNMRAKQTTPPPEEKTVIPIE